MLRIITTKTYREFIKLIQRAKSMLSEQGLAIYFLTEENEFLKNQLEETVQEAHILEWRNREELILNFQHQLGGFLE